MNSVKDEGDIKFKSIKDSRPIGNDLFDKGQFSTEMSTNFVFH